MAVQYDPIAKDESLNTTEVSPRNIADVLAEELSGIASALTPAQLSSLSDVVISTPSNGQTLKYNSVTQKWENANDAGGHVIEEQDGTDMTQRANLQFVDAHLTDDSVNDRTEIENIKSVTEAQFALETEDGFYDVTDEADEELTAYDIAYDSNDSIGEKIDDLDAEVNRGSVSVTADGVKTYGTLLNELQALVDYTKVTDYVYLKIGTVVIHTTTVNTSGSTLVGGSVSLNGDPPHFFAHFFMLTTNDSHYYWADGSTSITDRTSSVPSNGTVIKLVY